jgi:hypothetical protein
MHFESDEQINISAGAMRFYDTVQKQLSQSTTLNSAKAHHTLRTTFPLILYAQLSLHTYPAPRTGHGSKQPSRPL